MKKHKVLFAALIIFCITIIFNIVLWSSVSFCDWYRKHIFSAILNTYGRITSLAAFSVGEVMIIAGVVLVILAIAAVIVFAVQRIRHKLGRAYGIAKGYLKAFVLILSMVSLIMTLNCFVLYHATGFDEMYLNEDKEYTLEDLENLRNMLVNRCNELAKKMPRDLEGNIVYDKDIYEESVKCMKAAGEKYPLLSGYYPQVKRISHSAFMSQQYVCGVFFPFSMEANVNSLMYSTNYPATICHELAHIKGFIYEDEANLIGYVATVGSSDDFIKYSGYLSVLYYVDNDYYDAVLGDEGRYESQPAISDLVVHDNVFLSPETWKEVETNAVISTEVVSNISDAATDASLKLNGVSDGMVSYSKVVELLLKYEDGKE